jgi:GntR family transcriptional regulator
VFLKIEPDNGIAIYDQIVRQVKYAVAEGTLTPGQLVPSVRELARQITVNPNTIQRAYQQLQDDQVLETIRGRGLAVCRGAVKQCVHDRQELLRNRLEQVIQEGLRSGLESEQLRTLFEKVLKQAAKTEDM